MGLTHKADHRARRPQRSDYFALRPRLYTCFGQVGKKTHTGKLADKHKMTDTVNWQTVKWQAQEAHRKRFIFLEDGTDSRCEELSAEDFSELFSTLTNVWKIRYSYKARNERVYCCLLQETEKRRGRMSTQDTSCKKRNKR